MVKRNQINVGVIGVGIQGERHLRVYLESPFVKKIAVSDIDEMKLKRVSEVYKIRSVYTDYVEMLENEELDLVSVATPDFAHKDPTIEALRRGVNVIVEKPLATSVKDAEDMVNEAKKRKLLLFTNFFNRWNPPFALAKEKVEKGELGDPVYAYIRLSDTLYVPTKMLSWATRSNVVYFLMSHTADLVRWIFSDEVVRVRAWGFNKVLKNLGINTFDYVIAVLEFKEGEKAVLESAWILPESMPCVVDFKFEIIGSKGAINIDARSQGIEVMSLKYEYPRYLVFSNIHGSIFGAVKESLNHAIKCFIHKEKPLVNTLDGLINVKILCSILESIKKGTDVQLKL